MCMCPDQIRKSSEDVKRVPFPNLEREHWSQQKPTAKQASFFEVAADLATVSMLLQACLKKKMKMVLWPLSSRNPSWKWNNFQLRCGTNELLFSLTFGLLHCCTSKIILRSVGSHFLQLKRMLFDKRFARKAQQEKKRWFEVVLRIAAGLRVFCRSIFRCFSSEGISEYSCYDWEASRRMWCHHINSSSVGVTWFVCYRHKRRKKSMHQDVKSSQTPLEAVHQCQPDSWITAKVGLNWWGRGSCETLNTWFAWQNVSTCAGTKRQHHTC